MVLKKLNGRRVLTAVSLLWFALVAYAVQHVQLKVLNLLLASLVVPLVWLIWVFARMSAHQHANSYARDVVKVKGARPAPMPHQQRQAVRR